jgi:hypothetical protein
VLVLAPRGGKMLFQETLAKARIKGRIACKPALRASLPPEFHDPLGLFHRPPSSPDS